MISSRTLGLRLLAILASFLCGPSWAAASGASGADPSIPPENRVTLTFPEDRSNSPCFSGDLPLIVRLLPTGGQQPGSFSIPHDKNLIVTDLSWSFFDLTTIDGIVYVDSAPG